jgi:hypothetical protein
MAELNIIPLNWVSDIVPVNDAELVVSCNITVSILYSSIVADKLAG